MSNEDDWTPPPKVGRITVKTGEKEYATLGYIQVGKYGLEVRFTTKGEGGWTKGKGIVYEDGTKLRFNGSGKSQCFAKVFLDNEEALGLIQATAGETADTDEF